MAVGLIGLGNIGCHFASRLLAAGHELIVHDRSPEAQGRLTALGAKAAASARDVADRAEIVLLSLPSPAIAKELATGPGNVIDGSAVRTVLDLSTTGPAVTEEISALLTARGLAFVSAPVSGSTVAAENGTLTVMASGDADAFNAVRPLLEVIGKNIFNLGTDARLGQTMKLINNALYSSSMIATCEALVYGVKAGLDIDTLLSVLNVSSGRSFSSMERIPGSVLDRSFPKRFTTALLHKDVKMYIEDAERLGTPMFVNAAARQFLAFAMGQGEAEEDNVHIIRLLEEWAGVQVGPSKAQ